MSLFELKYKKEEGVYQISKKSNDFSDQYISAREKENRVYSDEIVKSLPILPKNHLQKEEWDKRSKSTNRFLSFLSKKKEKPTLLEIGCGNGWFSNKCSDFTSKTMGIDINFKELEQASRVFEKENLTFAYWNIIDSLKEIELKFDVIVINASIQYFEDFEFFLSCVERHLNLNGEIHILDSPFYEKEEVKDAKKRTESYYSTISADSMSSYYFHHDKSSIKEFKIMHKPSSNRFVKLFNSDVPFNWYMKKI